MKNLLAYLVEYPRYPVSLEYPSQFGDALAVLKRAGVAIEEANSEYSVISVRQPAFSQAVEVLREAGIKCE